MRYLALERELPVLPRSDLADLLRQEAAAVWHLQKSGVVREIWFTTPERHAVLILECPSYVSAREHLAALPLARAGRVEFALHELQPYDGHERLFAVDAAQIHARDEPADY
ncbi:MAG: superoxide dismutase [Opitutae bacterium]|nr:superoxide dismutase [Opitutae bacterium]